jgi:site-specific recombinase XerD
MENDTTTSEDLMTSRDVYRHSGKPKLLDQVRNVIRCHHYSIRTEQSYIDWIKRYILFHGKQHPENLNEGHVGEFLTHLAVQKKVAASTQNQALCAIVFLYKKVLEMPLGQSETITRAKKPEKLPVVFTREEVKQISCSQNHD